MLFEVGMSSTANTNGHHVGTGPHFYFFLSFFFPRLISVATDQMSTIHDVALV